GFVWPTIIIRFIRVRACEENSAMTRLLAILGLCCLQPIAAQSGQPTIAGIGYSYPVPLSVAPGQIITLFIQGVDTQLTGPVRANGTPVPPTLAGVSVTYHQGSDRPALLVEVKPLSSCFGLPTIGVCGTILAVTVQMPFEMLTLCPVCGRLDIPAAIS